MSLTSAPAATAVATPSAAPGTPAAVTPTDKKKGGRKPLNTIRYPGEFDEKGKRVNKLSEIPADYKSTLHKPLKKDDFVDEETFLLAKATRFEQIAAKLRKQAETIKAMGNTAQRGAAKKLLKMQESMKTLMETLKAQGVDVSALLQAAGQGADESADGDDIAAVTE